MESQPMTIEEAFAKMNETIAQLQNSLLYNPRSGGIREVIYNDPVTVVNWIGGEKTVVRCQEGDVYNERTGLMLCIAKRFYGNTGFYNEVLNRWCPQEGEISKPSIATIAKRLSHAVKKAGITILSDKEA